MNWFHLLTVIFVIAKITGYVAWSWWTVFMPSIICFGFAIVLILIVLITALIVK